MFLYLVFFLFLVSSISFASISFATMSFSYYESLPVNTGSVTEYLFFYRCDGLILLETFTTLSTEEVVRRLPPFLSVIKNVTGDSEFSMYNLSRKTDSHRVSKDYGPGSKVTSMMSPATIGNGST